MVFFLFAHIMLIIIERFISRSETRKKNIESEKITEKV